MHEYTQEETLDFQERAKAFEAEYTPWYKSLMEKHQVEMVYAPLFMPVPAGFFVVNVNQQMGDLKFKSVPSPLNPVIE